MTRLFADTSFYLAYLVERDAWHSRAMSLSEGLELPTVTTAWVLTELANTLSAPWERANFVRFISLLRDDATCEVVPASQLLFDAGLRLYAERQDKGWSLTDCISFVVMRERGIAEALTADRHFEQAGFVALLR